MRLAQSSRLDTCQKQKNKTQAHTCRLVLFSRTTLASHLHLCLPHPSTRNSRHQHPKCWNPLPSRDASPANSLESCRPSSASRADQPANQPAKKPCPRRADWPTGVATTTMTSGQQHHALGASLTSLLSLPSPGGSPPACPSLILSFCPSPLLSFRQTIPSLSLLCCNLQARMEEETKCLSDGLTHHTQPTSRCPKSNLGHVHACNHSTHSCGGKASQPDGPSGRQHAAKSAQQFKGAGMRTRVGGIQRTAARGRNKDTK